MEKAGEMEKEIKEWKDDEVCDWESDKSKMELEMEEREEQEIMEDQLEPPKLVGFVLTENSEYEFLNFNYTDSMCSKAKKLFPNLPSKEAPFWKTYRAVGNAVFVGSCGNFLDDDVDENELRKIGMYHTLKGFYREVEPLTTPKPNLFLVNIRTTLFALPSIIYWNPDEVDPSYTGLSPRIEVTNYDLLRCEIAPWLPLPDLILPPKCKPQRRCPHPEYRSGLRIVSFTGNYDHGSLFLFISLEEVCSFALSGVQRDWRRSKHVFPFKGEAYYEWLENSYFGISAQRLGFVCRYKLCNFDTKNEDFFFKEVAWYCISPPGVPLGLQTQTIHLLPTESGTKFHVISSFGDEEKKCGMIVEAFEFWGVSECQPTTSVWRKSYELAGPLEFSVVTNLWLAPHPAPGYRSGY